METPVLPEEQSEADLMAAFLAVVHDACAWARTEAQQDAVLNALYDLFVGVGDHDGEDSIR